MLRFIAGPFLADGSGRGGVQCITNKHPGRRLEPGEPARPMLVDARRRIAPRRAAFQRPVRIGWPIENGNGHGLENRCPVPPGGYFRQIVGPHDPDEASSGKAPGQRPQGIGGIAGAEAALDAEIVDEDDS